MAPTRCVKRAETNLMICRTWWMSTIIIAGLACSCVEAQTSPTDEAGSPAVPSTPAPSAAPAADEVDVELQVQRLLQRLDDRDATVRQSAEEQLLELGMKALPFLPAADDKMSAEMKERLARVRTRIEENSSEALTRPSQLTLQGSFSIAELIEQVEKQTGNQLLDFRDRFGQPVQDKTVTLDIQQKDFWPAMDQILDQAGMTYYGYVGQMRSLGLIDAPTGQRKLADEATYQGIFRLATTEVQTQRMLRTSDDGSLRLRLEVLWEPRVAPVLIRHAYADLKVTDDQGATVAPGMSEGAAEVPVQSTVAGIDLVLPLALPSRSAQKLTSIQGRLAALVPGREEQFEFENLLAARNVTKRGAGVEVVLERVRSIGGIYECRVRLRLPPGSAPMESHLDWASNNVCYLLAPDGTKVENPNLERYAAKENEVGFAYVFPVDGKLDGYKLIYRSPSSMSEVSVEYSLRELALP